MPSRCTGLVWDLAHTAASVDNGSTESIWKHLGGSISAARRAVWDGVSLKSEMVAFLAANLESVGPNAQRIERLIADLDHDDFAVREAAKKDLIAAGLVARPALERAFRESKSLEVRTRASDILTAIAARVTDSETLRRLRSIEILERIGSPAAVGVLERLAKGIPEQNEVVAAQQALRNLGGK